MTHRKLVVLALALGGCPSAPAPGRPTQLPAPDGPYAVGVADLSAFHTVAYYPAEAGTGRGPVRYATPELLRSIEIASVPVTAHASLGARPIGGAPRPAVVFAPGGSSFSELSTSLAERLASHGYVVVLVQPDVRVENGERAADGAPATEPAELALASEAASLARQRQLSWTIDLLADPFTTRQVGAIDLERIAVGGHSYGGSAAFNASLRDARVKASIDLDGALFEEAAVTPPAVPSLVVMASMYRFVVAPPAMAAGPDEEKALATVAFLRTAPHVVNVALRDAEHYDVTDVAAIAPALPESMRDLSGGLGAIATTHTSAMVLRFLDAALAPLPRLATAEELTRDLPGTVAQVF